MGWVVGRGKFYSIKRLTRLTLSMLLARAWLGNEVLRQALGRERNPAGTSS